MKRIKNYYCWYTVQDWLEALEQGLVEMQKTQPARSEETADYALVEMLEMAENDCIPKVLICIKDKKGYHIECEDVLGRFFNFLNNKTHLFEEGENRFFADFDVEKSQRILDAQIHSIWIDTE